LLVNTIIVRIVEVRHGILDIGDPGTHDPTMDAPCEAPAACRDSRRDNAHVVPTLHKIYQIIPACSRNLERAQARARARTAVAWFHAWFETKFRIKFRIIFQNICITFPLCSREHGTCLVDSRIYRCFRAGCRTHLQSSRRHQCAQSC
jgi:hypothetical protein